MVVLTSTVDSVNEITWKNRQLRRMQKETIDNDARSNIKTLIVDQLKRLLELCDRTPGNENKAYVATHVIQLLATDAGIKLMRSNQDFAKTVAAKMTEFSAERHLMDAPFFDALAMAAVKREARNSWAL